jgi:hypothetical protein
MQFVLPNRTPLPATREAGLVQIANALSEPRRSSTLPHCSQVTGNSKAIAELPAIWWRSQLVDATPSDMNHFSKYLFKN